MSYFLDYGLLSASVVDVARRIKVRVRPREVPEHTDTDPVPEPTVKKAKLVISSVVASYTQEADHTSQPLTLRSLIQSYLGYITDSRCSWDAVPLFPHYASIEPLLEFTFSPPATSAPVERIFSQGGLFVRPHRARISDKLLCQLMLAKCNRDVC